MLTYSFDNLDGETLYEHLYHCIKTDIIEGRLRAGFQLPSKRSFAKHLNISTITIENAYDQLVSEGFIYAVPRKGFYVSNLDNMTNYLIGEKGRPTKTGSDARGGGVGRTGGDAKPGSEARSESVPATGEPATPGNTGKPQLFADFASNQTEAVSFPFSTWAKITRRVLAERQDDLMRNPSAGGVYELREAIAEYLNEFRDIHVCAGQVIVGAGTEYLYTLLFQLLGKDKVYAVENPGYDKLAKILKANNMQGRKVALDEQGLVVNELRESGADVVHVTPSHHFPTGITMPVRRRYELLSWAAEEEERYIIEDDYDSEFRMNGRPVPALFSMDIHEKIIYMNTFTKSLASTIRISYMVLPMHLVKIFFEKLNFYANTVSTFEQYTLAEFVRGGFFEKHINRQRTAYRRKRNLILSELAKGEMADRFKIFEEDAGLHFLLGVETKKTEEEFLAAVKKVDLGVMIYRENEKKGDAQARDNITQKVKNGERINTSFLTLVINYSSIPEECIGEAVRRLKSCV